ncbi:hypothetical protein BIWAKO_01089 [Bosea sp. BIWAKO-01]|nr:hypothetical protein BIWAKO_01089 [Bosea sp. BIWAKO-01]
MAALGECQDCFGIRKWNAGGQRPQRFANRLLSPCSRHSQG